MLTDKAKEIISGVKSKMEDSVLFLEEDLKTYRVGKANPSILEQCDRGLLRNSDTCPSGGFGDCS